MYSFYSRIAYLKKQRQLAFIARHIRALGVLSLLGVVLILVLLRAQADSFYAGGTGTREDPYQIATCEQLQEMRQNLSSFYILINDIDCQSIVQGVGWEPVGKDWGAEFSGVLDGRGYTVTNFGVATSSGYYIGFFGRIMGGEVKNLSLRKGSLNTTICCGTVGSGGIAGYVSHAKITNVISDVSVVVGSGSFAGGFVGWSNGEVFIENGVFSGDVFASSSSRVGGLVGQTSNGFIKNSQTTGHVVGLTYVGGLVGNIWDGVIKNSFSSTTVTLLGGGSNVGGLIGSGNETIIQDSFSLGSVNGNGGAVIGSYTGDFANIQNSYFDQTGTGKTSCVASPSLTSSSGICQAVNTDGLSPSYFYASTSAPLSSWDFTHTWIEHASSTPTLATSTYYTPFTGNGQGTVSYPYQISSCDELQSLDVTDPSAYYILVNDIDCTGYTFTPIGKVSNSVFSGVLDGQNNKISNLVIVTASTSDVGMFSDGVNAHFKNLILDSVRVSGGWGGALATTLSGSVLENISGTTTVVTHAWELGGLSGDFDVSVASNINLVSFVSHASSTPAWSVGGLFGYANGSFLSSSTVTAYVSAVSGGSGIGGVFGQLAMSDRSGMKNVSFTGTINAGEGKEVGGLVGYIDSYDVSLIQIASSSADVVITGNNSLGGLVGGGYGFSVFDSFASTSIFTQGANPYDVGGLVGYSADDGEYYRSQHITNSSVSVSFFISNPATSVGGLIGKVRATKYVPIITSSFSSGYISAPSGNKIGGLIGEDKGSTVTNSFSAVTMNVPGATNTGGIAGYQAGASSNNITNTYWDKTRSGQNGCVGTATSSTCTGVNASSSAPNYFFSNTNSPLSTWSTSIWTFLTDDFPFLTIFTPSGPTFTTSTSPVVSTSSASFSFTTNIPSSRSIAFGVSSSSLLYTTQEEATSSSRTTSHTTALTGLLPCTTYYVRFLGTGSRANSGTSSLTSITTEGCTASSTVLAKTEGVMPVSSTTTLTLTSSSRTVSVTTPPNYATTSSVLQMKQLDATAILSAFPLPASSIQIGGSVYDFTSLPTATTTYSSFMQPLTITMSYSQQEIASFNEHQFVILSYHNGAWEVLNTCSTDTNARTVTCQTSHFSLFTLVGAPSIAIASLPSSPLVVTEVHSSSTQAEAVSSLAPVPSSTSTGVFLTSLTTTSSSTQLFTRVLRRGDEGEDVRLLQTLLNKYSFTLAPSGNGSPSQETTFFGPRTERALTKFQEFYASDILTPINKVKGSGVFGLLSRLKMEQLEGR